MLEVIIMGNLIKAIFKNFARQASDSSYNKKEKKVQNQTYKQVGKEIEKAQKEGRYFNPSKRYEKKYQRNMI